MVGIDDEKECDIVEEDDNDSMEDRETVGDEEDFDSDEISPPQSLLPLLLKQPLSPSRPFSTSTPPPRFIDATPLQISSWLPSEKKLRGIFAVLPAAFRANGVLERCVSCCREYCCCRQSMQTLE